MIVDKNTIEGGQTSELTTTTYSMLRLFRNCRKACEYRYINGLVPLEKDKNLEFGTVIHECLEIWHSNMGIKNVIAHIDQAYPNREQDDSQLSNWHLATAIMVSYSEKYPIEDFEVVELEKTFEGPIINPDTNEILKEFSLSGKVDGIVKQNGEYFILEHKTASQIDEGYLDRLWIDFQIIIYAWYIEQSLGIRISGVIYNVIVKSKIRQSKGETELEFEARRNELIAKSKTGKSSAKRKMPETNEDFQIRLKDKYSEPGMFHRELIYISQDQFNELRNELWELSNAIIDARNRKAFYRNTSLCFQYGRPCPYFMICRSGGNPNVIENHYQQIAPHEELRDLESEEPTPVF